MAEAGLVEFREGQVAAAVLPAPEIHGRMAGDAQEPEAEGRGAAVGGQGTERAQERVLRDLLHILRRKPVRTSEFCTGFN